jgi:hypothetical protein
MLAWAPMSACEEDQHKDGSSSENETEPVAAGLLYRLTVAFPSWAGAVVAVYSILLSRFGAFKIRPR